MNSPLVTIVTPVYNQGDYLIETISSVIAQTYKHIEYIIIDDGSTDYTVEILKNLPPGTRSYRQENIGQSLTLNKGWGMANGQYLTYLSGDDVLYPDAIEKLVQYLDSNELVACVYPDSDLIDPKSNVLKRSVCRAFDWTDVAVKQELYVGPGALFRKKHFQKIGGWRPYLKLAPDREFYLRLSSAGSIDFLPEVLAGYRMHPLSISYAEVSEAASMEYVRVVHEVFSCPGLEPRKALRKNEALARAYLLVARNRFRAGDFWRGWLIYQKACRLHTPLKNWIIRLQFLRNFISRPTRIFAGEIIYLIKILKMKIR
jgi:glycosyltransferase involved in cell wall biosynthesis